jgi:hypothetical protein
MMKNKKELAKNFSALLALALILLSGFLLPLFSYRLFGESFSDKGNVMINVIVDTISGNISFNDSVEVFVGIMAAVYVIICILYLLNGLGIIYDRYSRYASFLTIAYLFAGLFAVNSIHRAASLPLFGNILGSATIGPGIWMLPLIGISYLIFKRQINSAIRF